MRGRTDWRPLRVATIPVIVAVALLLAAAIPDRRAGAQESGAAPFYEDSARVDSMRARLSTGRLEALRSLAADEGAPRRWYDLGAALLVRGDWEDAIEPLEQAVAAGESDVAQDASYNLGLARALEGRPRDGDAEPAVPPEVLRAGLVRARDAFRRVLREDPGADDARWNLEIVQRWLTELGDGGGDGGGEGDGGERSVGAEGSEMTADEVRRLLEAAASEERRVQSERFERSRARDPVAERNW